MIGDKVIKSALAFIWRVGMDYMRNLFSSELLPHAL
jgi:hypothetical protein